MMLLMRLFSEVMNLKAWNIVSAQHVIITIIEQFSTKDKRTDLKMYLNCTAGWVFIVICLILFSSAHKKALRKQQ